MGFHEIKTQEEVAPNLVPMIDIMFLLLLFFMLNADMSRREMEDVTTPIANKAQEDKSDDNPDRIAINVFHLNPTECAGYSTGRVCSDEAHWAISTGGKHYLLTRSGLEELLKRLTALADSKRANPADRKSPSERKVLIRGDRVAPYGLVQKCLEQAAMAGLYKIEVACQIEKSTKN